MTTPDEIWNARIALERAKAAWWLLDALKYDYVNVASNREGYPPHNEKEAEEIQDWLERMCLEALEDALGDIAATFQSEVEPGAPS